MIRILTALILLTTISYAQTPNNVLLNGNIDLPAGCISGNNTPPNSNCPTFSTLITPNNCNPSNWFRTHGTPHWDNLGGNGAGLAMFAMVTQSGGNVNEGAFAFHGFNEYQTYYIHIKLKISELLDLWVRLASSNMFVTESPIPPSQCGESLTATLSSLTPPLAIKSPVVNVYTPPSSGSFEYLITYTVPQKPTGASFDKIWLYPVSHGNEGVISYCYIDFVRIYEESPCGVDVIEDVTASPIQTGIRQEKSFTIGSGNSLLTSVDPQTYTIRFADKIELIPNFKAEVTEGYFLAQANTCIERIPSDDAGGGGASKPGKYTSLNAPLLDNAEYDKHVENSSENNFFKVANQLSIYPNPTNGSITIRLPQTGIYNIQVKDIVGSTVHEEKLVDTDRSTIYLNNKLPAGSYFIQVSGNGIRHYEKIVLQR